MTHRGRGGWLIRHVGWHIMKDMAITTDIGLDKKGNMVNQERYSSLERGLWYVTITLVLQGIQSGYTAPLPGRGNFLLWGNLCHTSSLMSHSIPDMLSTFPDVLITPSDMSYTPRDMHEHFLVLNVICPPKYFTLDI